MQGDTGGRAPDLPPYPGVPLWVKAAAIIALALVLLVVIILVIGSGHTPPVQHGP